MKFLGACSWLAAGCPTSWCHRNCGPVYTIIIQMLMSGSTTLHQRQSREINFVQMPWTVNRISTCSPFPVNALHVCAIYLTIDVAKCGDGESVAKVSCWPAWVVAWNGAPPRSWSSSASCFFPWIPYFYKRDAMYHPYISTCFVEWYWRRAIASNSN